MYLRRGYLDPSYLFCGCHEASSFALPRGTCSLATDLKMAAATTGDSETSALSLLVMCCQAAKTTHTQSVLHISRKRTLESTGPQQCSRVSSKGLGTKPCMTPGNYLPFVNHGLLLYKTGEEST